MLFPFHPAKVYSEGHAVHFIATSRCSLAYCLWLVVAITVLVVPLILALIGDALWVRSSTYHERPVVTFTNNIYMLANAQPLARSAFSVRPTATKDKITLEVAVNASIGDVASLHFIGEFKIELAKKRKLLAYTAGALTAAWCCWMLFTVVGTEFLRPTGLPSSSGLTAWLRLDLLQSTALSEGLQASSESIFDQASSSGGDFLTTLGGLQAARAVSLIGTRSFPDIWSDTPASSSNEFTAVISYIIPEQPVSYQMEGFETLKFAWIQYLALALPIYLIGMCLLSFCYRNGLLGPDVCGGSIGVKTADEAGEEEVPPYSLTLEDGTVTHSSRDFTGRARAVYGNGEVYDGDFDEGIRHGHGTYWYRNGDIYTGQFQENEKHGRGRLVYTGKKAVGEEEEEAGDGGGDHGLRGGTYHGQFKEGQKHGQGTYRFNNGDAYSGDWCNGRKHGNGTYVYKDGSSIAGEWRDGSLTTGTWTLPNGLRYTGDFKDNKPHGEGYWKLPNHHTVAGRYVHTKEDEGEEGGHSGKAIHLQFIATEAT
ncbi:hypothetical protein FOL47_009412 [Perkinsus chesapeaki]|uniref:MORN repeat containing n=1 Tax=Perkinsus chesapeaki TaxID=330153 RepID=A0A7J6L8E8_PERCH|nr:hypothetical protein FOL47_009412 [Perkinsus chesapeaki]